MTAMKNCRRSDVIFHCLSFSNVLVKFSRIFIKGSDCFYFWRFTKEINLEAFFWKEYKKKLQQINKPSFLIHSTGLRPLVIWNLWRRNGKLSFLIDTLPRRLRAAKLALARLTSQTETEQKSHSPPPENQPLQTFFPRYSLLRFFIGPKLAFRNKLA